MSINRRWWREAWTIQPAPAPGRLQRILRLEEMAGDNFAFKARSCAAAVVALWLIATVPAPRSLYFLAMVGAFFLLGLMPRLVRRHSWAKAFAFLFIALDVGLIVAVILVPSPWSDYMWPLQMRLKQNDYLYLLLYLAWTALSYSPVIVVWAGFCIVTAWSIGFLLIYQRPETITLAKAAASGPLDARAALQVVLEPAYLGLSQLWNEIIFTAVITGLLAAAVWRARRTLVRQAHAEVTRADLARYVSPDVADALVRRSQQDFGAPATRHVSVLFADLIGFTGFSEHMPPERVVALLRSFHARCCKVVFAHGGTLDKFLGDGFMAVFGTLSDDRDCARRALDCAFALQAEMERWSRKRALRGAPPLAVAVGVHYGPVVVGNVGAAQRLEFTVIGDTVNVASRLERITRDHGCQIALSREIMEAAGSPSGFSLEPKGQVHLRGRDQPVEVFTWSRQERLEEKLGPNPH